MSNEKEVRPFVGMKYEIFDKLYPLSREEWAKLPSYYRYSTYSIEHIKWLKKGEIAVQMWAKDAYCFMHCSPAGWRFISVYDEELQDLVAAELVLSRMERNKFPISTP